MELSYWRSRWNKGNIGFHMDDGYPGLQKYWDTLSLTDTPDVLVPLSGKSMDMDFLSDHSASVTGVEISEKAVADFFSERGIIPEIKESHGFRIYSSGNIALWCGDFFRFPLLKSTNYDLIYDKAALVALPETMRRRYAEKILEIADASNNIYYLLHHFEYDESEMKGPPFSVTVNEIKSLFGNKFTLSVLEENELDIDQFEKLRYRGLKRYFRERLLLLHS